MSIDWISLTGATIADRYVLRHFLSSEGNQGRFATDDAIVDLALMDSSEAAFIRARLADWKRIDHPHLLRVLAAGEDEPDAISMMYVVTERADDSVANVLPERALSQEETRQVLESILPAVEWLHEQGLTHGAINPANIVAVGDQIKLTSLPVHSGGDPERDVAALRASTVELLTRQPGGDPGPLPSPFREVASASTLAGMQRALRGEPEPAPAPAARTVPITAVAGASGIPKWVWLAAGALVLAAVIWFTRRPDDRAAQTPPPAPVVVQRSRQPSPVETPKPPPSKPRGDYAVVAATYRTRGDAAKRVEAMRKQYSTAEVRGSGRRYMVVVASGLTKAEAERIRKQALANGLPRGTYVTKLTPP